MGLVKKIHDSIAAIGLPFVYGTAEELNNLCDNTEMPAAMCYTLQNTTAIPMGNNVKESANVIIFFIDRTSFAFDSVENEAIIQECKRWADAWLLGMRDSSVFGIPTDVSYQRLYLQFYQVYTGIGVSLTIRENIGDVICEP